MKQMELSTLAILIAVAEQESLSKAALKVHLAVGAVSKRITDVEATLGTPLFYRHARGVRPTPAGHSLVQHARSILLDVERMQDDISEFSKGIKGHVRIGATTTTVTQHLPPMLKKYLDEHCAVQVDLTEMLSEDAVESLQAGRIDIGIFLKSVRHDGIEIFPYRDEHFCLVTLPGHSLAKRKSLKFVDALDCDFVALDHARSVMDFARRQAGSKLRLRIKVRNYDAMCRVVKLGLGVGVMPNSLVADYVRKGELKAIPLQDEWATRELVIGVRSKESLTVVAQELLKHLKVLPRR